MPEIQKKETERSLCAERLILVEAATNSISEDVREIRKTLDGTNGSPGVIRAVDRLYQFMEAQKWFHRIVITAIISQVIIVLAAGVVYLIKQMK